jgi:hypothetical protein
MGVFKAKKKPLVGGCFNSESEPTSGGGHVGRLRVKKSERTYNCGEPAGEDRGSLLRLPRIRRTPAEEVIFYLLIENRGGACSDRHAVPW